MKTGPYDPQLADKSKYESVVLLGRQENDPHLILSKIKSSLEESVEVKLKPITRIISSDLLRTRQTADFFFKNGLVCDNTTIITNSLLREIKFDIAALCSEKEYATTGSDAVRGGFITGFINNTLIETRAEIKARCDNLIALIDQEKDNNTLIISHTFFIKIFTTYLEHPNLFVAPQIISEYIQPKNRIMKFCEIAFIKK